MKKLVLILMVLVATLGHAQTEEGYDPVIMDKQFHGKVITDDTAKLRGVTQITGFATYNGKELGTGQDSSFVSLTADTLHVLKALEAKNANLDTLFSTGVQTRYVFSGPTVGDLVFDARIGAWGRLYVGPPNGEDNVYINGAVTINGATPLTSATTSITGLSMLQANAVVGDLIQGSNTTTIVSGSTSDVNINPGVTAGRNINLGGAEGNDTTNIIGTARVNGEEIVTGKAKAYPGDFAIQSAAIIGDAVAATISFNAPHKSSQQLVDGYVMFSKLILVSDTVLASQRIPIHTAGDFVGADSCQLALFKFNATLDTFVRVAVSNNVPDVFKTKGYRDADYISSYTATKGLYFTAVLVNYEASPATIPAARQSPYPYSPYDGTATSYTTKSTSPQNYIAEKYALSDLNVQSYYDIIQIVCK